MKDIYKNELEIGNTLERIIGNNILPKGSRWTVIEFGIEPSTKKEICLIKNNFTNFILSCYQEELNTFKRVDYGIN